MITLAFPQPNFKIKEEGGKHYIFDIIRSKWLLLTEEEWVRQCLVDYLIKVAGYPKTMIALEKEIRVNGLKKRFDVLIYDHTHQPWMLLECKAPSIHLSEQVLQQVLNYNISTPVEYIVISNGHHTVAWQKQEGRLNLVEELPDWK